MGAKSRLALPPGVPVHKVDLCTRDTGEAMTVSILCSASLPDDNEWTNFLLATEKIRNQQWRPAFKRFPKPEHDQDWEWWGLWRERYFRNGANGDRKPLQLRSPLHGSFPKDCLYNFSKAPAKVHESRSRQR